jgi:hypothetical protein
LGTNAAGYSIDPTASLAVRPTLAIELDSEIVTKHCTMASAQAVAVNPRVLCTKIRNPKPEARNKYKIQILQCSKCDSSKSFVWCFGHLDFGNSNLFRISPSESHPAGGFPVSIFGFRIYYLSCCLFFWLTSVILCNGRK